LFSAESDVAERHVSEDCDEQSSLPPAGELHTYDSVSFFLFGFKSETNSPCLAGAGGQPFPMAAVLLSYINKPTTIQTSQLNRLVLSVKSKS